MNDKVELYSDAILYCQLKKIGLLLIKKETFSTNITYFSLAYK